MKTAIRVTTAFLLAVGLCAAHAAAADGPFEELLSPYHEVRLALLHDDLAGATEHARVVEKRAQAALGDPAASGGEPAQWTELVREISTAAAQLGSAGDLNVAREAFYSLSKPLGRYRKLVGDDSTIVAYCPMVKKAWLQPDGEIENPYQGQEMPTCGSKIPD